MKINDSIHFLSLNVCKWSDLIKKENFTFIVCSSYFIYFSLLALSSLSFSSSLCFNFFQFIFFLCILPFSCLLSSLSFFDTCMHLKKRRKNLLFYSSSFFSCRMDKCKYNFWNCISRKIHWNVSKTNKCEWQTRWRHCQ